MLASIVKRMSLRRLIEEAAELSEVKVTSFRSHERLASEVAEDTDAVVLAEIPTKEELERLEAILLPALEPGRLIFMGSGRLQDHLHLTKSPLFGGLINPGNVSAETTPLFGGLLRAFLKSEQPGIKEMLGPGASARGAQLGSTLEKYEVVRLVRAHFADANVSDRVVESVAMAADELLMNAIFDAPVDEFGKPLLTSAARDTLIVLSGRRRVALDFGCNSHFCAVKAIDYFGSLDAERLFSRITSVLERGQYRVDIRTAGAGLGLAALYRMGGSLLFHSQSGKMTEVSAFFENEVAKRDPGSRFQFIATRFS